MPESRSHKNESERQPRSRRHGIGELAAALLGSILDYLDVRLQLFNLEAREARGAIVRRIIAGVVGAFFLFMSYCCALTGGVAMAATHFDRPWPVMALLAGAAHLILAVCLILAARFRLRGAPFRDTRREFEKDREWLNEMRPPK